MYRSILKIVLLATAIVNVDSRLAQGADEPRVVVRIRTSTEIDGRRSVRSTIKMTTVDESKSSRVELNEGYLTLSVVDERDGEFSVRLDHYDAVESVVDSITILTSIEAAEFSFSSDRVAVDGTVSIEILE